ncbi:MAG: patatin-like phospholipase family protein, partial [Acidobacteriota bacterium]
MSLQPMLLCEVIEQEHLALYGPSSELELRATNFVALTLGYEPSWLACEENILDAGALLERWAGIANLGAPPPAASLTSALNDRISGPLLELKKHLGPHGLQRIETCAMDDAEEILKVNRLLLDEIFAPALQPVNESRLAQIYRVIHEKKTTSAFCISGGGIRSATFGLGVIQGLARRNLLDKFDFISTVSGGGYIGSWLSSWMRRHAEGAAGVSSELARPPQQPLTNEPQPLRHLREYSNYLTPRLGAGSGDTWTVAATYVRNLILNWLILVPLLLAVLMIPRIVASLYFGKHAAPEWFFYAVAFLALSFSMTYLGIRRPWKDDRRQAPPGTADLEFIVWCALPLTLAAVLLATQWARKGSTAVKTPFYAWLFFIVPPLVAGLVYVIRVVRASSSNPMTAEEKKRWWLEKVVREILASVAAGTAAGGLVVFYSKNVFPDPSSAAQTFPWDVRALYVCFAVPLVLSTLFAAATVFVGGASRINDDQDREWWARGAGWILALTMGWSVLSVIVIYGPVALQFAPKAIAAAGGVSGLVALLFGRSSTTAATTEGKGNSRKSQAARVAAPLFIVCILSALSLLATRILQLWLPVQSAPARLDAPTAASWLHFSLMRVTPLRVELILVLALLAVAFLAAWAVNINWFSMHSMYRNRLIRAYLGASRQTRTPNPFTGFDPQDDPAVHLLRPELLWFTTFRDFPLFVKRLEEARASEDDCFARNLALEVERRDGVLLDETLTNTRRREILFQTLNEILRESDLTEFEDKPLTVSMARRWSLARAFQRERQELKLPFNRLRLNRRILEKHFPTEIYPFDTPLIHRADIRNAHAFAHVARKFDVPADESKGSFSAAIETALPKINHWMTTDSDKPLPYPEVARRRKELTD